jgi:purine-binding chemotaxis protein CheW
VNSPHAHPSMPPSPGGPTVYASFVMGGEEFSIAVQHVQEVVNLPARIVPMPLAPDYAPGIFNLRGSVVPLLSMARLLGLDGETYHAGSKVVIVQHLGVRLGLLFDDTKRVLRPRGAEQAVFSYEDRSTHRVVSGVLRIGDDLIRVLDLDRLVRIENVPHASGALQATDVSRAKRTHKRCITFRVGGMQLGFSIHGVHEIVLAKGIEPSPVQDPLCVGVMHIRENVVPVVRFRDLLQIGAEVCDDDAEAHRVIVLQVGQMHIGLQVDSVEAITAFSDEQVMHVPVLTRQRVNLFAGCLDLGEQGYVFLLDSQCVMEHDEVARISGQHSGLFAAKNASALRTQRQAGVRETILWFDALRAFALQMRDVREIIDCGDALIEVPGAPDFVCGMYNLRGQLVTVVDVRRLYRLEQASANDVLDRKVVVLQHEDTLLGLQVDAVRSILHIDASSRYPVPALMRDSLPASIRLDVSEIIRTGNEAQGMKHLLMLDVARLFASIGERQLDMANA